MKKRIIFLGIVLLTFAVGCTEDFDEINTPSNVITKVDPSFVFNQMLQNPTRNYQRNISLYPDFYSQYWANIVSGFESPRYEYVDGWIGNQWNEFYTGPLADYNAQLGFYGEDPAYKNALAQMEIWMCAEWQRMTDTYGDIPYFGAGTGETVPYNSQQEIYYDLISRLTTAVNSIDSDDATQYAFPSNYDIIFAGDLEKWKRFGNSMRLRLAMRMSNVDSDKAKTEAEAAIADGVMLSNADGAHIPLWSSGWYDYHHQMAWAWDNTRASKTFTDYLYSQSSVGEDPRAWKWFTYKEDDDTLADESVITGIENGYNTLPANAKAYATINLDGGYVGFVGNGADVLMYMPYMFYSETVFLKAEAALRGWTSGDANALVVEGVQASMDYVGVDATAASDYINGLPSLTGSKEGQLKQLITQKYIANFPNSSEAWADFRRTDYPDISLPLDGVSGSASVAPETWVKRIRYPDNQHSLNSASMPSMQNTIDSDRMDIRLWWDTADTKTKSGGLMNSNF
ncbi:SusD/RagB family nutrient-binding outer membrane lipoprotein [Maribacter polysiphoniae]|uniref:SusD-like starch-binding protein associating with outer membrane n=1 Tax=Maribacter polysiphoniae TaxID=429344 RepID=A0A316E432_9FLAO|nr:SusD/RagB family nutrient-binding outer membrane lipoprotein [Maribacter polysiphoniae]MBD1259275.1 SusD/RagB family nutrient-binding outer membrane lipoprotein [Maribacter polysiphoniae]PWK24835.1 SusD-like starch-binding protein associating with outer membrane [Maribacter polysiphoniae]